MYSQNNEEQVVLDYFKDRTGNVLDIGAFDGITFSNSLKLIENGWKACLVEASSFSFAKCFMLHRKNFNVSLVNSCITLDDHEGLTEFYESPNSAVSTLDGNNLWYPEDKGQFLQHRKTFVPTISFKKLLSWYENNIGMNIDFLTVDLEGISAEMCMQFDPIKYNTSVICVEKDKKDAELTYYFKNYGFNPIYSCSENIMFGR